MDSLKIMLKQARNYAYLGKYDDAVRNFKNILNTIEQQIVLNNLSTNHFETIKKFQRNIINQKDVVETIRSKLSGLENHSDLFTSPFTSSTTHLNDPRRTSSNFRTTSKNYSISKTVARKPAFKDPDVWDPPPPLQKKPIKKTSKNIYGSRPFVRGQGANSRKDTGKKTFLADRYPNGNGPDANLIEMLEREVMDTNPNIGFDDVAQLDTAKGLLQQAVLLPLKMPQFFKGIRRAWKGVLMFGPPGTGKTLLAKAVASSGGTTFFNVSASSLASKWKGQSEKLVRILFQMAKFYSPSVIFFDEIDALGGKRRDGEDESNRKYLFPYSRVKTELLVQMDGATTGTNEENKFVIVLAATNRPWDLDEALRRRLEKRIYIPLPTEKGRLELVKINLKKVEMDQAIDFDFIVKKTEGFSGADLTNVCRQAAYMPMRRKLKNAGGFKNIMDLKKFQEQVSVPLQKEDFLEALKTVNKSVGKEDIKKYELWMKQFGSV